MIEEFKSTTLKAEKIMFDCKNKQIYVECKDLLYKDSETKILKLADNTLYEAKE